MLLKTITPYRSFNENMIPNSFYLTKITTVCLKLFLKSRQKWLIKRGTEEYVLKYAEIVLIWKVQGTKSIYFKFLKNKKKIKWSIQSSFFVYSLKCLNIVYIDAFWKINRNFLKWVVTQVIKHMISLYLKTIELIV